VTSPAQHRGLVVPAFVLALAAAGYSAYLFGQAEGRDFWQSPLLLPHLIVAAMLAGAASLVLVVMDAPSVNPGALAAFLSWFIAQGRVPADCWRQVGAMIAAVHRHGVDHPDLTAHNVLLDDTGKCFLVDFDNAQRKAPGDWSRLGIERFNRSLRKVALETGTEFDSPAWAEVLAGYTAT